MLDPYVTSSLRLILDKEAEMVYTVKKLAKISGVSVRALHFYDEIGLLKPAFVGMNGYRHYGEEELLLLQQILFYRELGFSLSEIKKILSKSGFDKITALKSHRKELAKSISKTKGLIKTIDKTISRLQGEKMTRDADLFCGFDSAKQKEYERQLIEEYGEGAKRHIRESKGRVKDWTKKDWDRVGLEFMAIIQKILMEMQKGTKVSHPLVQELVDRHFRWLSQFWTPNRESYAGHGRMLAQNPEWRKFYEQYDPSLVDFFRDAIEVYAESLK